MSVNSRTTGKVDLGKVELSKRLRMIEKIEFQCEEKVRACLNVTVEHTQ